MSRPADETLGLNGAVRPGWVRTGAERWVDERSGEAAEEVVAEEVPLALVVEGEAWAVMLGTPCDLEDFALGFALSEGLVRSAAEIEGVEVRHQPEGIELHLGLAPGAACAVPRRERALAGRTGCGLCGVRALAEAVRVPAAVEAEPRVRVGALRRALDSLPALQRVNRATGAVHAAAWAGIDGRVRLLREDVGRHNALDKLVGALARGTDTRPAEGFALVTSRASYEMVQKTAAAGIAVLVAVSAPTALAVRVAELAGVTLVGFARNGRHNVYSHPRRLEGGPRLALAAPSEERA